jgi:hypothetical protein
MSTELLDNVLGCYPGWEAAISDAEQQALECEQKAVRLRAVADVFRKKRNAGEPWPETTASTHN